jgi:hypothetical protein
MVPQFTEWMPNEINLSIMGRHLEGGYIEGQAAFYVSLENRDDQFANVRSSWDAHWHFVNEEFEMELQSTPDPTIRSF